MSEPGIVASCVVWGDEVDRYEHQVEDCRSFCEEFEDDFHDCDLATERGKGQSDVLDGVTASDSKVIEIPRLVSGITALIIRHGSADGEGRRSRFARYPTLSDSAGKNGAPLLITSRRLLREWFQGDGLTGFGAAAGGVEDLDYDHVCFQGA